MLKPTKFMAVGPINASVRKVIQARVQERVNPVKPTLQVGVGK